MMTTRRFLVSMASILLAAGLTACNKNPAETAGKSIDQAVKKTSAKIDDASKSIAQQTDNVSEAINDAAITTKVKTAILTEPNLKTLQIHVNTLNGVTTLSGSVSSEQNRKQAQTIAAAVTGVKNVENQLIVTPIK